MRKLVVFCHLSLDGIAAIPSGKLDWITYNNELQEWANQIVKETDTTIYGNVTYELMKYWRTIPSAASPHEREHARWIENVEKVVFSKKKFVPDWNNTRVITENAKEEILELKKRAGKNITIFGSPTLANYLIKLGLVDEYYLSVSPIVLGEGKFLFKDVTDVIKLKLVKQETFKSGAFVLHYAKL